MPLRTVPNRALHVGLDADDDVAVETGARRATLPNIADLLTAETAFRIEFCKPLSSAESSAYRTRSSVDRNIDRAIFITACNLWAIETGGIRCCKSKNDSACEGLVVQCLRENLSYEPCFYRRID